MSMWFDKVIDNLSEHQIINDSKTPSGKVHVGSLRGVLIHDALYRALKEKDVSATYKFGIDDYDPLDGLPADAKPELVEMMGMPLCNIPAPAGSRAPDLAEHYIAEFLEIFQELGVGAEIYRMRDIYRSGQFNEAIDVILKKVDIVRDVYRQVSNANKSADWHPFQIICEKCGKIGSSEVTHYDGKEVVYHCRENLVSWAKGCGYTGKTSPFNGNGKLPWKLEWVAKWHAFGITIEGAGKDHCTKGGSRDVANQCLKSIFGEKPPLNVPYEFFLVSGAKMSSSMGIGSYARAMADFLPPEILRFLMVRSPAKRTVNFSTDLEYIVKLFNEYDRLIDAGQRGKTSADQNSTIKMTIVEENSTAYHPVGFQLLISLLGLPHIDINKEVSSRLPAEFNTPKYQDSLKKRITSAKYWLDNYSTPEQRFELQESLPESVTALSETQRAFLNILGTNFPTEILTESEYQTYVFDICRLTPIPQKQAFTAIYTALFDKDKGPKAGSLFSYMDKKFLTNHFKQAEYSTDEYWQETAVTKDASAEWLSEHAEIIENAEFRCRINVIIPGAKANPENYQIHGKGVIELEITLDNHKKHLLRILLSDFSASETDLDSELEKLENQAKNYISELQEKIHVEFKQNQSSISKEDKVHA
jgi:lysyl-tRNA synthetase, class I